MKLHKHRAKTLLTRPTLVHWALFAVLPSTGVFAACGDDDADYPARTRESLRSSPRLRDQNPDPQVFEVQLVAATGKQRFLADGDAEIWGYRDGSVSDSEVSMPGPLLEVALGQQVIVHFRNELPEATTIHWHGLLVGNSSDGTPAVQSEVEPGGTFDYEFVADTAGTFWYHPHVRSDTQIERGLYAPIVVHGGSEVAVDKDRTIVLDDVKMNADGTLSEDTTQLDVMLGRQGNVLLANGTRTKEASSRPLVSRSTVLRSARSRAEHQWWVTESDVLHDHARLTRALLADGSRGSWLGRRELVATRSDTKSDALHERAQDRQTHGHATAATNSTQCRCDG